MRAGVTNLVEVEDPHVHFGAARAVDGASLHVSPGEVLALVGESGSGKTTLIRAIQGLQKPTSGQIRVEDVGDDGPRPKIQTIFNPSRPDGLPGSNRRPESPDRPSTRSLPRDYASRTVTATSRNESRRHCPRAGLRPPERFFPLYPHEVSGGQRRPRRDRRRHGHGATSVAGRRARGQSRRLDPRRDPGVDEEQSRRRAELAISSSPTTSGSVRNIADRVAVMYLGRIVETGPPSRSLKTPGIPTPRPSCRWSPRPKGDGATNPQRGNPRSDPYPNRDVVFIRGALCSNPGLFQRTWRLVAPPMIQGQEEVGALTAAACWAVPA